MEEAMRYAQYASALLLAATVMGCDGTSQRSVTAPDVIPASSLQSLVTGAVVTLDPVAAVEVLGASRTVNATVIGAGGPVEGARVVTEITGAFGFRAPFACTTSASGQCSFTYNFESVDVHDIRSCIEGSTSGCGEAMSVCIEPLSPGKVTGGGYISPIDGTPSFASPQLPNDRVTFGFNAQGDEAGTCKGRGVVVDHLTKTVIKLLTVDVLAVGGITATFSGQATIDGTDHEYEIEVTDESEPGIDDTFTITVLTAGYMRTGTLAGGNIQIHNQLEACRFGTPA